MIRYIAPLAKPGAGIFKRNNPRFASPSGLRVFSVLLLLSPHSLSALPDHTTTPPVLLMPRVGRPPTLEDFLDMKPDGGTEKPMAKVENFVQRSPSDAQAAEATHAALMEVF